MATFEDALDLGLTIESVVHLPSLYAKEGRPGNSAGDDFIDAIGEGLVSNAPFAWTGDEGLTQEDFHDLLDHWFFHNPGAAPIAVRYETPVAHYLAGTDMFSQSFRLTAWCWFWGDSFEDCAIKARRWRDDMHAQWKRDAERKAAEKEGSPS